jgi:hypothetical protein
VPICRAAFGALEKHNFLAPYPAMARDPRGFEQREQRRVRRWVREIALAVVLTVAAATFIVVALLRDNGAPQGAPQFETARKPLTD